jgi:GT2 family glycosyltransferase
MDTTVVIASRDRRESLLRTLGELERLPDRPPVVVVDNGSSDGTPDAVRSSHPSAEVIGLEDDRGPSARTLGARAADTPLVAFADDDSWWAPEALARAAGHFRSVPRLGLLAARILVGPEHRLDPTCALMAGSPLGRRPGLPGPEVLGFVACGSVVRRDPFLQAGGFDGRFGFGGEEQLLAIDLTVAGWACCYAQDVVAHHHPAPVERHGRRRLQVRNQVITDLRRRRFGTALSRGVRAVARGGPAGAAAAVDVVAALPWALRDRRVVPARVERALRALERT